MVKFSRKNQYGLKMYWSTNTDKYSILYDEDDKRYFLRIWENGEWRYPLWATEGFATIQDVESFLTLHDWENATSQSIQPKDDSKDTHYREFQDAMKLLGFHRSENPFFSNDIVYEYEESSDDHVFQMRVIYDEGTMYPKIWVDSKKVSAPTETCDIRRLIRLLERNISQYSSTREVFSCVFLDSVSARNRYVVTAGITTRDMLANLVRVKSSNMWGMAINIKENGDDFGDVIVQFKGKDGGPDDVYQYLDIPVRLYRRWVVAPSKGHFFWQYIRDNFKYRKLTGDKRGKLPNAVN